MFHFQSKSILKSSKILIIPQLCKKTKNISYLCVFIFRVFLQKMDHNIKKAISLSFLLIVATIIGIHAVIPHHHHNGISVILASAHHDDSYPNDPNNTEIFYTRLNNERQTFQLLDSDFDLFTCFFVLLSDCPIHQIAENTCSLLRQNTYLPSNYTALVARSTGMRAPPF